MTAGVKDMLDNIGIHNVTSRTEQPREHSPLAAADTCELGDHPRLHDQETWTNHIVVVNSCSSVAMIRNDAAVNTENVWSSHQMALCVNDKSTSSSTTGAARALRLGLRRNSLLALTVAASDVHR